MGTVATFLEDWSSTESGKESLYASEQGKIIRWLNEAQLRFTDKSECLRSVWQPTITSAGVIALPSNFKREIKDRVKWTANRFLKQIDYPTANIYTTQFSDAYYYSIWGSNFYVWQPQAGTPDIPYITKPTVITASNISSADLEIPTEYHAYLMLYLDSMWARTQKDIAGSIALLKQFDNGADSVYTDIVKDNDPVPMIRGTFF